MKTSKELTDLVVRLERMFPKMEMYFESETFGFKDGGYQDCIPPRTIDWYDFLENLGKNGLCITNKKDVKSE